MRISTAVPILLNAFEMLQICAYPVQVTTLYDYRKFANCRKCLERFIPHADFTYNLLPEDDSQASSSLNLKMIADIADAIPIALITSTCQGSDLCLNIKEYDAPTKFRLFGVDMDVKGKEIWAGNSGYTAEGFPQQAVFAGASSRGEQSHSDFYEAFTSAESNRPTHCVLLGMDNFYEMWMHACLQCLAPNELVSRFSLSNEKHTSYHWLLRFASEDSSQIIAIRCSGTCGTIRWGSRDDCLVAELYTMTLKKYYMELAQYTYTRLDVNYSPLTKDSCLKCLFTIVDSLVPDTVGENKFRGIMTRQVSQSNLDSACREPREFCSKIDQTARVTKNPLENFKEELLTDDTLKESKAISRRSTWTSPHQCMHIVFRSQNPGDIYKYPIVPDGGEQDHNNFFSKCLTCLLEVIGDEEPHINMHKLVHHFQPTSHASALVFFRQTLNVHGMAIWCQNDCVWVTGLSDSMCGFTRNMVPTIRESTSFNVYEWKYYAASSHIFVPNSRSSEKLGLLKALQLLRDNMSSDIVWFIQFENRKSVEKKVLEKLMFCIAAVSNVYVLSTASWYILTTPFDYMHAETLCNLPEGIQVVFHERLPTGFNSQPLNSFSITSILKFSRKTFPETLIRTKEERRKFLNKIG